MCQECMRLSAFEKGPEALAKAGGQMLCFLCTRNYKRKLRAHEMSAKKRERPEGEAHNGSGKKRGSITSSGADSILQSGYSLEPNWRVLYEDKEAQAQTQANDHHAR